MLAASLALSDSATSLRANRFEQEEAEANKEEDKEEAKVKRPSPVHCKSTLEFVHQGALAKQHITPAFWQREEDADRSRGFGAGLCDRRMDRGA
eukprot:2847788-Rhodomonas_salina.3